MKATKQRAVAFAMRQPLIIICIACPILFLHIVVNRLLKCLHNGGLKLGVARSDIALVGVYHIQCKLAEITEVVKITDIISQC